MKNKHLNEGSEGFVGLDIGCGTRPKEGWIGLDITPSENTKTYDMTKDAVPYADDSVDAIRCINTLEHIERKFYVQIFNDWRRALKICGTLEIIVPNAAKDTNHAWGDITHVAAWFPEMIEIFTGKTLDEIVELKEIPEKIQPWTKMTLRYLTGERPRYADYGIKKWTILNMEDLEIEPRDLHVFMTPLIDKKTGKKYE